MAKKDSSAIWVILIIAAIGVFYYGGTQGWFKGNFSIINQETTNQLESPITISTCTASISPSTITAGNLVSGTVQDGSNTFCEVYGKMVGTTEWRKIAEGTTNSAGSITFTDTFSVVGTFYFRAICGDCLTNQVTLIVNAGAPEPTCTDTDGINKLTPGFVNSGGYYYDDCAGNWAVKEYYCNGNTVAERVIACDAGYICFETRGGDYCKLTESIPPSGDYGGYLSCDAFRIAEGKEFYSENSGINNIDECEAYANGYCTQFGWWVTRLDFAAPDCCIFDCSGGWD